MPIIKPITAPNSTPVTFHKATQVFLEPGAPSVAVTVASWADEDAHNAGAGRAWTWDMDMPVAAITGLDAALALTAPFDGGTVVSDDSQSLAAVQLRQCALLDDAYAQAISRSASFTTVAGDTHTYQSDPVSVSKLSNCLLGWIGTQAVPEGFYFQSLDNTHVPFTYADLQGLAAAFINAGFAAFALLQNLKTEVRAATTLEDARAVTWPNS